MLKSSSAKDFTSFASEHKSVPSSGVESGNSSVLQKSPLSEAALHANGDSDESSDEGSANELVIDDATPVAREQAGPPVSVSEAPSATLTPAPTPYPRGTCPVCAEPTSTVNGMCGYACALNVFRQACQ
jgi:hypothetical protein